MGPRQLITSIRSALESLGAKPVFFQDVDYPGLWIIRSHNPDVDIHVREVAAGRAAADTVRVFCRRGLHAPETVDADAEAVMNVINRWRAESGAKCGDPTPYETPYETHAKLKHHLSRYSPDGYDIIEECNDCGARWLHHPGSKYPESMPPPTIPRPRRRGRR